MKKKPRKMYPSDKNVTTLRVSRDLHAAVKAAAARDRRTIEGYVDIVLNAALDPKKI